LTGCQHPFRLTGAALRRDEYFVVHSLSTPFLILKKIRFRPRNAVFRLLQKTANSRSNRAGTSPSLATVSACQILISTLFGPLQALFHFAQNALLACDRF
jgi:hypothetical protein